MHRPLRPGSVVGRLRDVERIPTRTVAGKLRERRGTSSSGDLLALENEHPRAFGQDEARAARVEGTGRPLGVSVPRSEGVHHAESRHG